MDEIKSWLPFQTGKQFVGFVVAVAVAVYVARKVPVLKTLA